KTYKKRFLVKLGDKLFPTPVENIRYFIAEDKLVFLINDQGKKFPVDFTLDDLDEMLDPSLFFRLNRQYTAHIQSIEKVTLHINGKLRVFLHHVPPLEEIYVSREKASAMKAWLGSE
ncbi:MAG: LytTR family transcriptional regulator DNA-binding domain-containing protein, partial [Cytophagales bacterium]|nr:LytTR family transcriptional regulator DNA-binding domain-containing protein [Cytophagales bacterium]